MVSCVETTSSSTIVSVVLVPESQYQERTTESLPEMAAQQAKEVGQADSQQRFPRTNQRKASTHRMRNQMPALLLIVARINAGLTQSALAEKVGVTPVTISRWENGVQTPRPYALRRLCFLFQSSPEDLGFSASAEEQRQRHSVYPRQKQDLIPAHPLANDLRLHCPHCGTRLIVLSTQAG